MLRIGYPLDSHVTYKTDGTPVWDRAISSAPYRKLIKSLFSDGVLPNPSTNLQVSAGTGMKVNLYAGFAICNGCQKLQETNMSLDIATASAVNDRIDTVILRLNDNDDVRECEFYVLTGTPAVAPVRPALTQTDSIWEIGLADVLVKANSTQISNANITDTRYETARCGIISSISEFDTTTLYQQVQADLQEFRDINQAEFIAWVDSLENKLSGDVAGNLQLQINELNDFVDHGSLYSTNTETFKDLESGFYRLRNYKSDLFPGSVAVTGTMQKNVVGGHHTGTIITTDGVNYTRFADYDSSGALVSDTGWKKMSVDTLTTMEQVEASTDDSKAVGAGAVKELSSSLGGVNFITEEGKGITGYTLTGADTVFPFSSNSFELQEVVLSSNNEAKTATFDIEPNIAFVINKTGGVVYPYSYIAIRAISSSGYEFNCSKNADVIQITDISGNGVTIQTKNQPNTYIVGACQVK